MSQVKSCDCETCKLKVDLYERDKTNGIRENVNRSKYQTLIIDTPINSKTEMS